MLLSGKTNLLVAGLGMHNLCRAVTMAHYARLSCEEIMVPVDVETTIVMQVRVVTSSCNITLHAVLGVLTGQLGF